MASTGNLFPATGESVARAAATAWTNPGNVVSDNATDATCASGASGSAYLVARNFTLTSVPANSTINGITVRVEASEHSTGTEAASIQLQDASAALLGASKGATISGTTKAIYTLGGSADLWSATITPATIHDVDFGVRFWFTTTHYVRVDYITLAVEYTAATHGRADSTETALSLGIVKIRATGVATETDTAEAPTVANTGGAIEVPTGVALESDATLSLSVVKIRATGASTETDESLSLTRSKILSAQRANETDSAIAPTFQKNVSHSFSSETDEALSFTITKGVTHSFSTETDAALGFSFKKIFAPGLASEVDTAYALSGGSPSAGGPTRRKLVVWGLKGARRRTL